MKQIVEEMKEESREQQEEKREEVSQKVALVTGGGQGIGRAIVRRLARLHYLPIIADIDEEAGKEVISCYRKYGDLVAFPTDVRDERAVQDLMHQIKIKYGRLDVLVNDAAISITKPVTDLTLAEWNAVIGTNLTGAFLCAKYSAPLLRTAHGVIVNIASTRAFQSETNTEAYSASKGGIVSLSHALALSLGPDIRVNCISPGWIEVSDWKKASIAKEPVHSEVDRKQHPAGRVGIPNDIANMVAFLVDPVNSFITGANFVIDGGMTRKMIYM